MHMILFSSSIPFVHLTFRIVIQRDALYRLPHAFHSHVLDRGIVFYVYAPNNCSNGIKYMPQTVINAQYIKEMDCDVSVVH